MVYEVFWFKLHCIESLKIERKNMSQNRRQFLKRLGLIGAGSLASVVFKSIPSFAAESCDQLPPGAPAGMMVKTLHYIPKSNKKGQMCGNCIQFGGDTKSKTGKCNIFQGCDVAVAGWCSSWSKKG